MPFDNLMNDRDLLIGKILTCKDKIFTNIKNRLLLGWSISNRIVNMLNKLQKYAL